jgi:zinc and cadmium transporter
MIDSQTWIYTLVAVFTVSLIALIGIFAISDQIERLRKRLLYLVSFAAGAMLGDVFIHLVPEVFKETDKLLTVSLWTLGGIVLFLLLEKFIFWRHCHVLTTDDHPHQIGLMNIIGDALHNFLDGAIIAGSFLVSPGIGFATTIAVILHEIPQEIGDFGVLLHAGYSKARALTYNFLSALAAVVGAVIALSIGGSIDGVTFFLVPLTVGGFLYIALSDLLPQIHEEPKTRKSFQQFFFVLLGIGIMALMLFME